MVASYFFTSIRMLSSLSAGITRPHRAVIARTYPTVLVLTDGSTINIRYHEPRRIIKLPVDLSLLTEEEQKIYLMRRKPKKQVKILKEIEDTFNAKKYLSHFKKSTPK